MKIDITGKKIVRDFQRRRRIVLAIVVIAGALALLAIVNLGRMALGSPKSVGIAAVFLPVLGILAAYLIASILFYCPNCHGRPWTNKPFSLDPAACGGCRARLKDSE